MDVDSDKNDGKKDFTGAMDAFTVKDKKESSNDDMQRGRKRKKVLEEKTYIDENGLFRTEMVTVWKEVEEEMKSKAPASVPKPKKKVKSTKGMKQQGLKGFFVKKK